MLLVGVVDVKIEPIIEGIKRLPALSVKPALALLVCCAVASAATLHLRPTQFVDRGEVKLESVLLPRVGAWHEVKSNLVQMSLTPEGADRSEALAATYDDTAMTSYADVDGNQIMVALAYGRVQRQEGKIHRPELCYSAQGFSVGKSETVPLTLQSGHSSDAVLVHRIEANSRSRREIVSYWIRIGDLFSSSAFDTRTYLMKTGLGGQIPDGILFRVSQIVPSDLSGPALEQAYAKQERFMSTLANSLNGGAQQMLLGDSLTSRSGDPNAAS